MAVLPADTVGMKGKTLCTNPFSLVDIDCFADVTYHQTAASADHRVVLRAPEKVLENIAVQVEEGKLRIAVDRRYKMPEKAVAVIDVYAPFVNRFLLDGGKCLRLGKIALTSPLELMVNGNVGTGLITGMGYLAYAALFALILGAATMAYTAFSLRPHNGGPVCRTLHIIVPEDLDYIGVFEPVLDEYTRQYSLTQVKTTNMGSLFKLTYDVTMKDAALEKKFIDQLRLRNGNLEIALGHQDNAVATL